MVFKNCLGMIMSVSTFIIGSGAATYSAYLEQLSGDVSGVMAISPNGNRLEYRFCRHPDCLLSDDEVAARAIARCNRGVPLKDPANRCLVFDRNGKVNQPYRTW